MNREVRHFITILLIPTIFTNLSCDDITEPLLDNKKVELVAPVSGVVSRDSHQQLFWNYIDEKATYELQVVSPRFDSIVSFTMDTIIDKNTFPIILDSGVYEWRVKALNNSSGSQYSDSWKLTILESDDKNQ